MIGQNTTGSELIIFGTAIKNNIPIIGAYVVVTNPVDVVVGRTTTDKTGSWQVSVSLLQLVNGKYSVKFYGSGMKTEIMPDGDSDYIEINYTPPPVQEILEVRDLEVLNANNVESGVLNNITANLKWADVREMVFGHFPTSFKNGLTGEEIVVTYAQAQKVYQYEIFMYVSDDATPPSHSYPANDPGWVYYGASTTNTANVRCPATKYVAFWVGFRTKETSSQIPKPEYDY